ncbi:TIGR02234 family membrane protein [[Mycobacterium] crassicus]|uniref:TIGR02234 family membrane protein n=1 Tax=[Mycobacterium] crassicus TaxID=2872309 RepID=A0ABU5XI37_9MYCO|nr:TIGR02234 family membrane protein [Mycolicibacter sp. MYC098]MEB3021904.1 TIGR02234 family membrane protein [Mycolicibacter sp. MYC098]
MADDPVRRGVAALRSAQVLLVLAAGGLWGASRLPWVLIRSFDGLGQPRLVTVSGASWSTALVPLGLLCLAAAVAAVAVRGWKLRVLAVLMAAVSLAGGYLAISMWVVRDIAVRALDIAEIPVTSLQGTERRLTGAVLTLVAALCVMAAAALLMRAAARDTSGDTKYAAPAARRAAARGLDDGTVVPEMSERLMWDALDEGYDPTGDPPDGAPGAEPEGR